MNPPPRISRAHAIGAIALLVAGWALTLWVAPWSDERVNDLFVYRGFAEPLLHGALPYRDFAFEYPPLAAPLIGMSACLLAWNFGAFTWLMTGHLAWRLLDVAVSPFTTTFPPTAST